MNFDRIDLMVTAAIRYSLTYYVEAPCGQRVAQRARPATGTAIGRMFVRELANSIAASPDGVSADVIGAPVMYNYRPLLAEEFARVPPLGVLKVAWSLATEAVGSATWRDSEAHWLILGIIEDTMKRLPGWYAQPTDWTRNEFAVYAS